MKLHVPKIFKNIQFMRLWGNQLFLQVSFNMCNYTALLILADRTHSPFIQAQLYAALTLPAFIFGFIAGPAVDMFDKKKVMLISNFLLIIFFAAYIFSDGRVAIMMLIAFLTSSVARFFIPAEAASIPRLVRRDSLEPANTFFIFTLLGSVLLGYAIAGPIIQLFGGLGTMGEIVPFIIGSFLLILSFIFLLGLRQVSAERLNVNKGSFSYRTLKLFLETFNEVKKNRNISITLGLLVFVEFIVGTMSILLLEYVRRYLQLPLTSVSYVLIGPLVLGLMFGVTLLSKIERHLGQARSILFACSLVGIMLLCLGSLPLFIDPYLTRFFAGAGAFLMGVAVVVISVQSRTILQLNTPKEMHGRIFSFLDILIALVTPVPVLILGFVADKISMLWVLNAIGALVMIIAVISSRKVYARTSGS